MTEAEAEFRHVYEAHRVAIHAYFTGRLADGQAAADLTQEVFLRAWRHLDRVRVLPADGQRAWLFTVARNLTVDAGRRGGTQDGIRRALAADPASRPAMVSAPASAAVLAAERAAVVGAAISRLPEAQRVTLAMATAGGLTGAQIAGALGVPAGTVRYRLSEARRALAAALRAYDDDDHQNDKGER